MGKEAENVLKTVKFSKIEMILKLMIKFEAHFMPQKNTTHKKNIFFSYQHNALENMS